MPHAISARNPKPISKSIVAFFLGADSFLASADCGLVVVVLFVTPKPACPPKLPPTLPTLCDCEVLVPLATMALSFCVFSDLHFGQVRSAVITIPSVEVKLMGIGFYGMWNT